MTKESIVIIFKVQIPQFKLQNCIHIWTLFSGVSSIGCEGSGGFQRRTRWYSGGRTGRGTGRDGRDAFVTGQKTGYIIKCKRF